MKFGLLLVLLVMDGPSPLLSNGILYVFDSFAITAIDHAGTPLVPPQHFRNVLPLDLSIVEFSR
jgi:hypothetical protein